MSSIIIDTSHRAIAVVGLGAILPDAPDVASFWANLCQGRDSITPVQADRWDPSLYWNTDPAAPDKTYSRIGGWVRDYTWDPRAWKLAMPPRVVDAMDVAQRWAVACTWQALSDYGYPDRPLDLERTGVILGNAMAGEKHYLSALRISFPEYARWMGASDTFRGLPAEARERLLAELHDEVTRAIPSITEDTMPGELSNVMAGRVANLFNLRGPNYVCDAACASAMAAADAAIDGLVAGYYDAVLTGGIDRNMGASTFVKFCKIGALSASGSRPYAAGADGFVMGEGGGLMLLKRLADAERDGDRIYAVIRGFGASSDGRGRGITAPNPVGQQLAIRRGWENAGLRPVAGLLVEGHGTSTRVGDRVEVESLDAVFREAGLPAGSVALGSVKSNFGHLKGAAGAAGLIKAVLALHHRTLPPSLNWDEPNPGIDWSTSPFRVNTQTREWTSTGVRQAAVSAFGFGGTNFHAVLEEHVPGRLTTRKVPVPVKRPQRAPVRGAAVIGAPTADALGRRLADLLAEAEAGRTPPVAPPSPEVLAAPHRIAIDFADAGDLAAKVKRALKALATDTPVAWRSLGAQGVHRGKGRPGKVAFLFPGQGSQYVGMGGELARSEPAVREIFAEADRVCEPLLGRSLTSHFFVDSTDAEAVQAAEERLRQTEVTQPAVLTVDVALWRLLGEFGFEPDMVMGHSLGEYAALVAAGALPLAHAIEAVSARGREMANVRVDDPGRMAAVTAPLDAVREVVESVDGYVVVANLNSRNQVVIGGGTAAVEAGVDALQKAGYRAVYLSVSHAFHTAIVAPASAPLRRVLERLDLHPPARPVVSNVTGDFYPSHSEAREEMLDLLAAQVASPVQFVEGLETLYEAGARIFVEVGPKRALLGFATTELGDRDDVVLVATNHARSGDVASFNNALCALWAAGLGGSAGVGLGVSAGIPAQVVPEASAVPERAPAPVGADKGRVVVSGAAPELPGTPRVFDDGNVARILDGEQLIDVIPRRHRQAMVELRIVRLHKDANGAGEWQSIDDPHDVIKLAGRAGAFDLVADHGVPADRSEALDRVTRLAIAVGVDALRDAGIPLVLHYRATTTGSTLPDRWMLPQDLRDETGVIFASAFPGYDALVGHLDRFHADRARRDQLAALQAVRARATGGDTTLVAELDRRIAALQHAVDSEPFAFNRRFLFQVLSMGHSQFAEYVGARGPNTAINAACASTTQAVAVAHDWIRIGRCRRVIVVAADDVTSDNLLAWIGAGFLATGAAATDEVVEEAALPFDRRRHGMLIGMGAAALVIEEAGAAAERGLAPIAEILGTTIVNSAFHGTRLDVEHIGGAVERLIDEVEARWGLDRHQIAAQTLFMSHETYTPARGGSASAEIHSLRQAFGPSADAIVIANTKGFTGHAMGAGIEDVVAIKALETGIVPPVANFREPDPELGHLNLSKGGAYPVEYALRLSAGFGSQLALTLYRRLGGAVRPAPHNLGYTGRLVDPIAHQRWLDAVSGQSGARIEVVDRTLRVFDPNARAVARPEQAARPAAPVEPVASRPAPAAIPVSAAPVVARDDVVERVLALVAEQTGYPVDMLELDLDLEADLGIDTVKQAEVMAAVREEYDISRDENISLRDYPTLAHVIGFVRDRTGIAAPVPAPTAPPLAAPVAMPTPSPIPVAPSEDAVISRVLALVAEQTGYPVDMLELDLDLEADLGIDTVKQAEVMAAVREEYGISRDENISLRDYPTLAHVIGFVRDRRGVAVAAAPAPTPEGVSSGHFPRRVVRLVARPPLDLCAPTGAHLGAGARVVVVPDRGGVAWELARSLEREGVSVSVVSDDVAGNVGALHSEGPIDGVFWLPALDDEGDLSALSPDEWRDAADLRVKSLFALLKVIDEDLGRPGAFFVAGTRTGGSLGGDGATAALGGAVGGLCKALAREHVTAVVKVVDLPLGNAIAGPANILQHEARFDPGVVEVGYRFQPGHGGSWPVDEPMTDDLPKIRGMQRVTLALSQEPAGPVTRRLGRDTVYVVTGAAGSIVSAIVGDLARTGGSFHLLDLTPAPDPADADLAAFRADPDALRATLAERLRAQGERATPAIVNRHIARLERAHAALSAVRSIEAGGGTAHWHSLDLTDSEAVDAAIDEVRRTHGRIDVLLHAAGLEVSRRIADKPVDEFNLVFDVKARGWFNLLRAARGMPIGASVAFSSIAGRFGNAGQTDYSAANDFLARSAASLRTKGTQAIVIDWTAWADIGMASRGSIPKLMAAAGIEMLPPSEGIPFVRRELETGFSGEVVAAGTLGAMLAERHPNGGLDPARLSARGPMVGEVRGTTDGIEVRVTIDPSKQGFLDDHRIDGTAVLPGVMGIEAFAEAAALPWPDLRVVAVEDVRFLAPFKFYRDEPRTVTVRATFRPDGDDVVAECTLLGERLIAGTAQVTEHFQGRVRLSQDAPEPTTAPVPADSAASVDRAAIYRVLFHGPAYQVCARAWRDGKEGVVRFSDRLPPNHAPDSPTRAGPRLLELAFQAAGLLEVGSGGAFGLPRQVTRVVPLLAVENGPLWAIVRPVEGGAFDVDVVDATGAVRMRVEGYQTIALPDAPVADLSEIRGVMG